jgi:hypothetical protein
MWAAVVYGDAKYLFGLAELIRLGCVFCSLAFSSLDF